MLGEKNRIDSITITTSMEVHDGFLLNLLRDHYDHTVVCTV